MRLLAPERPVQDHLNVSADARKFDPFDPEYVADPYQALRMMQEREPVFYAPSIDTWLILRRDAIRGILRDPARFSPSIASDPLTPLCPEARQMIQASEFDVPPLLVNNGSPDHPHCRRFFGEPLKPARMQALAPFIEQTVDSYIDRMIAQGPPSDLATMLTWDVPALVLFKLLGVPQEDVPIVKAYADSRVELLWGRPTAEEQIRLTRGAIEFFRYTSRLVHSRLEAPRDDYPSDLIRARAGDDSKASIRNIIAVTFNLLFAGHETSSSAAANTLSALLSRRDLWRRVVDGELAVDKVVEEGLRFDPPVQAWRRQALVDVEIDGVEIPAGSHMLLVFAAANRDPLHHPEPDRFDPDRADAGTHMSFGMGAHFCLGAPLARLEIRLIIERLAKRMPDLHMTQGQTPAYLPNTSFRGLRRLQVRW